MTCNSRAWIVPGDMGMTLSMNIVVWNQVIVWPA